MSVSVCKTSFYWGLLTLTHPLTLILKVSQYIHNATTIKKEKSLHRDPPFYLIKLFL